MPNFAQGQLERHGWKKGEGLGKEKRGISKAIQVTKKNDLKGIGHKADNFEFAWWDHVYNKVSSNVQVDKTGEEVNVKLDNGSDLIFKNQMGIISTDMPTSRTETTDNFSTSTRELTPYQLSRKIELYSQFVKAQNSDNTSEKRFLTKISDKELFNACGKLTARKGARAEQVGKLERTQHIAIASPSSGKTTANAQIGIGICTEKVKKSKSKSKEDKASKSKKKKSKKSKLANLDVVLEQREIEIKKSKKSKKKSEISINIDLDQVSDQKDLKTKKSKKPKKKSRKED